MSLKAIRIVVAISGLLVLAPSVSVIGGEEPAGGEVEVKTKSWFDLFKSTGMVGILLLGCSMVGTALLIQYLMTLNATKLDNPQLLNEVESLLSEGNVDDAFAAADADTSYAGRIAAGAIARSGGGYEEAKKGLEESAIVEGFRLNAKLSYLSLIGNIGPLLGLLGTVTGMISSFQIIETMKAPTPGDLAKGVYESLVNTTIGLFIAIVFLSAFFFMKNKVSDITLKINNEVSELLSRVFAASEGGK